MKAPAWFGARRPRAAWVRGSRAEGACPELIVLCGPSHSGKSTFARQHLGSCRVVSTDRIRKELGARFIRFEAEPEVWRAFEALKCQALREGLSVVLDACHMSKGARRHALQGPNDRHRRVCIVFDVPLATVRRRCLRDRRVALHDVERMWQAFQQDRPSLRGLAAEGFDEVWFVGPQTGGPKLAGRVAGRWGSGSAAPGRASCAARATWRPALSRAGHGPRAAALARVVGRGFGSGCRSLCGALRRHHLLCLARVALKGLGPSRRAAPRAAAIKATPRPGEGRR